MDLAVPAEQWKELKENEKKDTLLENWKNYGAWK